MNDLDRSHDPAARSWVASANDPRTDFPLQNLPFGVFRRRGMRSETARIGVAIGEEILDLTACASDGVLLSIDDDLVARLGDDTLNRVMARGRDAARTLRLAISDLLRSDVNAGDQRAGVERCLLPARDAEMSLPAAIGDFSDFYASIEHATNVGSMFRPDNPLLPNYKWMPIGYHGRASSIVVSGTDVVRPFGQTRDGDAPAPTVEPSRRLDYELEIGAFVGRGSTLGARIPIAEAGEHVFGLCLLNDWSARDVQAWEYQPLGPFLAKSFATSISPWLVTLDALAPFRVPARARPSTDPMPLAYLSDRADSENGGFDITLEVYMSTSAMRDANVEPVMLSRGKFSEMYWTVAQLLAHHSSNGCNLRPGDLLGSGTVSGAAKESRGCLLERAWRGTEPVALPTGEIRSFLQDGDDVILRGYCEGGGARRIGFGECRGRVLRALPLASPV
ncbi:MAG TPA: fumarylacetoacetase [Gemmatimonadaceae bacterium]|nr:fumarylacetoacetase [Gemmatimonadaceae bacterium]